MKRVLCFLLVWSFVIPTGGWGAEAKVEVDEGPDDPIGDVLFFPFRVIGEAFSTSGYEYDPDDRYAWYPDYYGGGYYYWNDPWYYDKYDYYRYYRYRHGPYFGYYYDPWYYRGGYRHYRHHKRDRHHDGGRRHDGGKKKRD